MCNLTRTAIWLNLVVRLICSIWRRRQSDKLAAKAIWCLSGNQSHVARKLPAPNASDQSQQRGPDQIARLRRAGLGPDWGQIGVCQSGNLAIRRRFCRIAFDWPETYTYTWYTIYVMRIRIVHVIHIRIPIRIHIDVIG